MALHPEPTQAIFRAVVHRISRTLPDELDIPKFSQYVSHGIRQGPYRSPNQLKPSISVPCERRTSSTLINHHCVFTRLYRSFYRDYDVSAAYSNVNRQGSSLLKNFIAPQLATPRIPRPRPCDLYYSDIWVTLY